MIKQILNNKNFFIKPWFRLVSLTLISVIIVSLILLSRHWLASDGNLPIRFIDIQADLKYLKKVQLRQQLKTVTEKFTKTNLYNLKTRELEETLEKMPWIRNVSLRKVWPQRLIIEIEEQEPIAFWGKNHLLTKYGEIFKGGLESKTDDFPTLYSPDGKGLEMGKKYSEIIKWLHPLNLSVMSVIEDGKGSLSIRLRNDVEINLGRKHHKKRLKRFVIAYKKILKNQISKIKQIDLRYTNGFSVAWY